ncbi:MAG: NUDIX domain-containing protein [Anaerolineae bacterium]|nr:NUDIX domain-containing protein [Anaerolineae bacterium]
MSESCNHIEYLHPLTGEWHFCPHCGTPLSEIKAYGRVRHYCPACQRVVFREHKVAAATVVENHVGQVLLVKRALNPMQGHWSLPAGFVDFEEPPAVAAVRECFEETGLEVAIDTLLDVVAGREHKRGADIVIVYRAYILGGDLVAADDAAAAEFFPLDNLPLLAFKATEQALNRLAALRWGAKV